MLSQIKLKDVGCILTDCLSKTNYCYYKKIINKTWKYYNYFNAFKTLNALKKSRKMQKRKIVKKVVKIVNFLA